MMVHTMRRMKGKAETARGGGRVPSLCIPALCNRRETVAWARMRKSHIAYYISAHGYGHGVRSADILNALLADEPSVRVTVVTDLPARFLENRLAGAGGDWRIRAGAFDVGMVQRDSIRVDVAATLEKALDLLARRERLVAAETSWLREADVDLVVADIPSIPLEAASVAGIPGVAVGNFSWDWIYAPFAETDVRWKPIIEMFAEGYRRAETLLKLPFSPAMDVFRRRVELPLLAKPGTPRRQEMAQRTGADEQKIWVLLSFTTLDWDEAALATVAGLDDYEFFTVKPLAWSGWCNIHAVDRAEVRFSDVLASCEVVVSKPGFGILSDCVANAKPLVYAEREDFIEYPLLERELKRYLKHVHIPAVDLYAGRLGAALSAVKTAPEPPESMPGGGAEQAAALLRAALATSKKQGRDG
jgi:hypothetical protein